MTFILTSLVDIIMTLTPVIPYFAQVNTFNQNKSSKGFSIKISLFILSANILRIFFWFGERFNISLLFQSVLMIIAQLYLVKVYVEYSEKNIYAKKDNFLRDFWDWDKDTNYFLFITTFILFFISLSFNLGMENKLYVNFLGSLSSFLEAIMPCAQILKIYNEKSAKNFSYVLISSWVLGDSFKVYYYFTTNVPIQMLLSAIMQVVFDFVIVFQIIYYNNNETEETDHKIDGKIE